jgi:hypothetical protein
MTQPIPINTIEVIDTPNAKRGGQDRNQLLRDAAKHDRVGAPLESSTPACRRVPRCILCDCPERVLVVVVVFQEIWQS